MYALIPISNILLEDTYLIGDVLFSSKIAIKENKRKFEECLNSSIFLDKNTHIVDNFTNGFAIYKIKESSSKEKIEELISYVDLMLDILRLDLNSFKFHEQVIGTPGLNNDKIMVMILDENFNIITSKEKTKYYSLVEGIGADVTNFNFNNDFLLLPRTDEVYTKYRNIIHKACKAFQIYDLNNSFTFLFSLLDGLDCIEIQKFGEKKKRMLSFTVKDQEEYERFSQQFYLYSKEIRTKIVHSGELIEELISKKTIYSILSDLYFFIIRFSEKAIKSGETNFESLNKKIEEEIGKYNYEVVKSDTLFTKNEGAIREICDYYGIIYNLNIEKYIKINGIILVPSNSRNNFLKLKEVYEYGTKVCIYNNLDEKDVKITSDFPYNDLFIDLDIYKNSFSVWDVGVLYTRLFYDDINNAFAVMEDQTYLIDLEKNGFNIEDHSIFLDFICNNIQKVFSYFLLQIPITKDLILPSKVGILNGTRCAKIRKMDSVRTKDVLGKVFNEYREPITKYTPYLENRSEILYKCLYDDRKDEVFLNNQSALHQVAECMYLEDINYQLIRIFNIMDMLNPKIVDGDKLISQISTFLCSSKNEKNEFMGKHKSFRKRFRNPILHGGKNINDLSLNYSEGLEVVNIIKNIIIDYCKVIYSLNITSFDDLKLVQAEKNSQLK